MGFFNEMEASARGSKGCSCTKNHKNPQDSHKCDDFV